MITIQSDSLQGNFLSQGLMDELRAAVAEINQCRAEDEPVLELFMADQVVAAQPGATGRSTRARYSKVWGSLDDSKHDDFLQDVDKEDSDDSLDLPLK
jgi:hypothetical protein